MKKLTLSMIFLVVMSMIVYAVVTGEYVEPDDDFYHIKTMMGNFTFKVNATPTRTAGVITNISIYTNHSGTWSINGTNVTNGTIGSRVNRTFETNYSAELSDGLVFSWNAYVCDNISTFINEDVTLEADLFTIFDNNTNTTGDGLCLDNSSSCIVITAGRGRVANYPFGLDGFSNTTSEGITGNYTGCQLNDSTNGYFICNQTINTYNGTDGLLSTGNLITSSVKINYTINSTCRFIGANRTIYVEDAVNVALNSPTDLIYSNSSTVTLNFTPSGDSDTYTCQAYSNDTGNWSAEGGANSAISNNTYRITSKVFTEGNGIVWNVRCAESDNSNVYGWALANYTVNVDTTDPAITINSPVNNSYSTTGPLGIGTWNYSFQVNISVIDTNVGNCTLKVNGTDNITSTYTSNVSFTMNFNATDGVWNLNVECDDLPKRTNETTNRTITIDSLAPGLNRHLNYTSSTANCKGFTVEFNFSEVSNATFTYGTSSMAQTHQSIEVDFAVNQTFNLTFNESYETDFFSNVSFRDRAGNLNDTITEMTITSPVGLCTGWTVWGIYDSLINYSDLYTASTADYVYHWNNSDQAWESYSSADTGAGIINLGIGDVVHLYESTNTTWFRNITGEPDYVVNVTGGHVYFPVYYDFSFHNISHFLFRNQTYGNVTGYSSYFNDSALWFGGLEFQIDYLAGYNNSGQEYVSSIFGWGWENTTTLGKNYKNGIDTLWAYVDYNLTINFTRSGNVLGNWT